MAALWAGKSKIDYVQYYALWWVASSAPAGSSFGLVGASRRTALSVEWGGERPVGSLPSGLYLGGGVIVAPRFGGRVHVKGGYACLHFGRAGPH